MFNFKFPIQSVIDHLVFDFLFKTQINFTLYNIQMSKDKKLRKIVIDKLFYQN